MIKFVLFALAYANANTVVAESLTRILVSQQNENDKEIVVLKSTLVLKSQKYYFEMCSESNKDAVEAGAIQLNNCRTVGSHEGYTREQLAERIETLESNLKKDRFYDVAKITLGTLTGAVAGGFIGARGGLAFYNITQPRGFHDGDIKVFNVGLGGFVVGGVGSGVLTHYLVWDADVKTQIELLKNSTEDNSSEANVVRIELVGIDMLSAIRDLNVTLAGIF